MTRILATSTLVLGLLAAAQSAQAAVIDSDGNPVPGQARIQERVVVMHAYAPYYVVREVVAPFGAFAATVVSVNRPVRTGLDGDGNPVPGAR